MTSVISYKNHLKISVRERGIKRVKNTSGLRLSGGVNEYAFAKAYKEAEVYTERSRSTKACKEYLKHERYTSMSH
jgi:hypothetical protein